MKLEDYFEFEKFDTKFGEVERIRIKGHRISIEHVLEFYHAGLSPDQIQREQYPSLTLEEVYATVTYYLHNKVAVDAYLERGRAFEKLAYEEYLQQEPSEVVKRLRALSLEKARETLARKGGP